MTFAEKLEQLELFFKDTNLPNEIDLGPHGKIIDVKKFVDSHFEYVKNGQKRWSIPYLKRLDMAKQIIIKNA